MTARPEDNMGAGHLGTVEFHSATLYRYATINVKELAQHLTCRNCRRQWWDSSGHFCCRCPQVSKIHSQTVTVPDLAYITLRRDQPVNLAGAFERPVRAHGEGYVNGSVAGPEHAMRMRAYQILCRAARAARFALGHTRGGRILWLRTAGDAGNAGCGSYRCSI